MIAAMALLFRWAPRRHQPAWSWLAYGAAISVLGWVLATAGLGLFFRLELVVRRHVRAARRHRRPAPVGIPVVGQRGLRRRGRRAARGGARPQGTRLHKNRRAERRRAWSERRRSDASTTGFSRPHERGNPDTRDRRPQRRRRLDRRQRGRRPHRRRGVLRRAARRAPARPGAGDTVLFTGLEGQRRCAGCCGYARQRGRPRARRRGAAGGRCPRARLAVPRACSTTRPRTSCSPARVNDAGGEVLLDHRVRRGGSHHQKLVVVRCGRRPARRRRVRRRDGPRARSPRRRTPPRRPAVRRSLSETNYGPTPPWHDVQVRIEGPAVDDVAFTFRGTVGGPDAARPPQPAARACSTAPRSTRASRAALPPERDDAARAGSCAIQVLRTYPARTTPYPFAPEGERSIARAYIKSFRRARRLVYLEDQYLWSFRAADELCAALRREPDLLVVHRDPPLPRSRRPTRGTGERARPRGGAATRSTKRAASACRRSTTSRTTQGTPIYVHSKVCIVDDIWLAVGSDNLNRRSWTHDSEISCAMHRQPARRPRAAGALRRAATAPACSPGTPGSGWRVSTPASTDGGRHASWIPRRGSTSCGSGPTRSTHGTSTDESGPRPPGHLRRHRQERTTATQRRLLDWVHAHVLDPDGRPDGLKALDEL